VNEILTDEARSLILECSIVMIGTLTGLQWMIYDSFKIFMGLPTTGGAAPPEAQKQAA
jgi:solute carrier family 25 (mitochondrial phosphate transporter), member 3